MVGESGGVAEEAAWYVMSEWGGGKICVARVIGVNGRNLCWKRPQLGRPVID